MKIHTIQWREEGKVVNADVKAESLEEAKMKVVYMYGVNPNRILKDGAWR